MRLPTPTPSSLSPIQGSGSLRKKPFPNKLPPFQSRSRTFSRFRFPRLKLFLLLLLFLSDIQSYFQMQISESLGICSDQIGTNSSARPYKEINRSEKARQREKKIGIKFRLRTEKKPEKLFPLKRDSLFRVTDDCHRFSSFYLSFSGILRSFQN